MSILFKDTEHLFVFGWSWLQVFNWSTWGRVSEIFHGAVGTWTPSINTGSFTHCSCCVSTLFLRSNRIILVAISHKSKDSTGSQRGGPWSPGALKFPRWSPEPYHFTDRSPDPFLAVEPGAQRHFARSLEPSIFKFDHSSSQITLIFDYCLFVFVCAC